MSLFWRYVKALKRSGFVKMSVSWSVVCIHCILRCPLRACSRKWCYLMAIWRVHGLVFRDLINSTQPLLSSKTVECAIVSPIRTFVSAAISLSNDYMGIESRMAWDKAIYSASIVLKVISVCSLDAHNAGQMAKRMTRPVLDLTEVGSWEVSRVQLPVKSAST